MILIRTSFIRRFVNYFSRSKTIDLTDLADAFVRSYGGAFEYPIGYEVNRSMAFLICLTKVVFCFFSFVSLIRMKNGYLFSNDWNVSSVDHHLNVSEYRFLQIDTKTFICSDPQTRIIMLRKGIPYLTR